MSDRDGNSEQGIFMVIVFFYNVSLLSGKYKYVLWMKLEEQLED